MPHIKPAQKNTRRARQTTAKPTKQTTSNSRHTKAAKPATAPKRTPAKVADFDHRFAFDHWCLADGFILLFADDHRTGYLAFGGNPEACRQKLEKRVGRRLQLTSAVPASRYAFARMEDALPRLSDGPCSSSRYHRTEAALEIERKAGALVRQWCNQFKKDGRAEEAERRREWRLVAASHVKAHNAFMATLTKHSKALAALAH